jgi:hypothetical protein
MSNHAVPSDWTYFTVKISKSVKRAASLILDNHIRGAFVRSYVVIEQDGSRQRTSRNKDNK